MLFRSALLVADSGRKGAADRARALLKGGSRVVVVDPYGFGESKVAEKEYLFSLLVGAVGERPLGLASGQVLAAARWRAEVDGPAPRLVSDGPRTGVVALVAAALDAKAISGVELNRPMSSLKEVLSSGKEYSSGPELFCFGLLGSFDLDRMGAMVKATK